MRKFVLTTVLGGVLFLIPFVLVVVLPTLKESFPLLRCPSNILTSILL